MRLVVQLDALYVDVFSYRSLSHLKGLTCDDNLCDSLEVEVIPE